MRERIAQGILLLTLCLLTALSYVFAKLHNPEISGEAEPVPVATPAGTFPVKQLPPGVHPATVQQTLAGGRAIYARERCATCHSIAGAGNPRAPLDGVGDRRGPDELKAWTTGSGRAAELLPAGIIRRKERYRAMAEEDLEAMMVYLSSLRRESE
jgi:mono/diheme cytochrome c family protein